MEHACQGRFCSKVLAVPWRSSPRTGDELCAKNDMISAPDGPSHAHTNMLKGTESNLRALGIGWNPVENTAVFEVTFNFSKKKRGVYTRPHLKKDDLPQALPLVLT